MDAAQREEVKTRHAILASIGTDGDLYPFLGLGLALRARGCEVTLATHQHFQAHARAGGLNFYPLVSDAETNQLLAQPDFWHPVKGAFVIGRWGVPMLQRQYEALKALALTSNSILIANPGLLAARVVQEEIKVPLASVILQPWVIPSVSAPSTMMGGLSLPRWAPRSIRRLYFRLIDEVGARLFGREISQLRKGLGLKRIQRMFQWWFSPELVIAMFPEWFGEPQPDWPSQIQLTGFPLTDGRPTNGLPQDLVKFCGEGKPVVAFTFGTGMMHAAKLFRAAVEACRMLRINGILLTSFGSQLPEKLPSFVHHCQFAPFQDLFPLCAAVVHHGGIGTVSKALAAGRPQLIVPSAFDQLDNALRVTKLGAGTWLKSNRAGARSIARAIAVLISPEASERARGVAKSFGNNRGLERAADLVELLGNHKTATR